ncbi:MAG TPA: hypothetical protein VM639_08095 [Dongiaceae bacterium]|nr:hypothetical protein [Dongiaceae bacterium]
MLEAHGLLQLTMRSESYRREAQILSQNNGKHASKNPADEKDTSGSADTGTLKAKSAVALPKGATSGPMKDFWQRAADKAAERAPSADTMKKLQDASKSDNKEIAAQKMQQAKAKLQSLRLQAQLAAASGDKQQLRRLAQEVAAAAREVASAAHDLAGGVVDSVSGDSGAVPLAATGGSAADKGTDTSGTDTSGTDTSGTGASDAGASGTEAATRDAASGATRDATPGTAAADKTAPQQTAGDQDASAAPSDQNDPLAEKLKQKADDGNAPLYAQEPPQDGDKFAWGQKALNSLSTDANNALSQARGLLAFIASLARGKRKAGEGNEDDRFFNELQRVVDDAQAEVNHDISAASQELVADQADAADAAAGDAAGSSLFGIESVTVTQVTTTAVFLNITT